MNQLKQPETGYQSRDPRTTRFFFSHWNGAWGRYTALMALGPKFLWNKSLLFTLLVVLPLDVAVGVGMILVNKNYFAGTR